MFLVSMQVNYLLGKQAYFGETASEVIFLLEDSRIIELVKEIVRFKQRTNTSKSTVADLFCREGLMQMQLPLQTFWKHLHKRLVGKSTITCRF